MGKSSDLKKEPVFMFGQEERPELPVKVVAEKLDRYEGGAPLELTTRGNTKLAFAVLFAKTYTERFHSKCAQELINSTMRLARSMNGESVDEQIRCLQAGGQVPDAYYNSDEKKKSGFSDYSFISKGSEDD